MVASINNFSHGQVREFVEGIVRFALRSAHMAQCYVETLGIPKKENRAVAVPKQFALEIAALMQLARWERGGLGSFLPAALPSARAAEQSLWRRINEAPLEYVRGNSGAALCQKVLQTWLRHFAPAGLKELGVDVLLVTGEATDPLEEIADLLWQFRHLAYDEETS